MWVGFEEEMKGLDDALAFELIYGGPHKLKQQSLETCGVELLEPEIGLDPIFVHCYPSMRVLGVL